MKAVLALGVLALASAIPLDGPIRFKLGNTVLENDYGLIESASHEKRANGSSAAVCGKNKYSSMDIKAAQQKGCQLQQNGTTVGDNDYPHQYKNLEGFDFSTASPWYEWPILSSHQVYDGGSPSTDRVIFNENCEFTDVITHTGASGNNFKECDVNTVHKPHHQ